MSGFEVYKDYLALKSHFTNSDYDYVKYCGKINVSEKSYNKRKDKIFFDKLAKNKEYHKYLLANFSINPQLWIRDIAYSNDAELIYNDWLKRNQSLTYNFKKDFQKIMEEQPRSDGSHPSALRLFLGGKISLESLCIFVSMIGALKIWDSRMEYDPIWEEVRMRIVKYTPFVKFDRDKIKQVMIDILDEMDYNK